jgi:hypothetical protein
MVDVGAVHSPRREESRATRSVAPPVATLNGYRRQNANPVTHGSTAGCVSGGAKK